MHIAHALIKFWRRMFEAGEAARAAKAKADARRAARRKRTSADDQPNEAPFNLEWLKDVIRHGASKHRPVNKGYVTVGVVMRNGQRIADHCRPHALDKAIKRHQRFMASKA